MNRRGCAAGGNILSTATGKGSKALTKAFFIFNFIYKIEIVALSFVFDKYYPIMY
jgi:hypothetical protein